LTRDDTVKVLSILKTSYPRFYANMSRQDAENAINLWFMMFANDDVEDVKLALYKLISTFEFPPSIAELRKALAEITTGNLPDAGEAWGEVVKAIREYGVYREQDALNSMSKLTARVVRQIGWESLCMSDNPMADRAHFLKIYAIAEDKQAEYDCIPEPINQRISENIRKNQLQGFNEILKIGGKADE
jgi:hypothetical protein